MSVKTLTTAQIRADLRALALTWPEGIPVEQTDRMNALKGELKRRGEEAEAPAVATKATQRLTVEVMSQEALEKELRSLSEMRPDDEVSQKRFADIRFELRKRARVEAAAAEEAKTLTSAPVRALELPDDEQLQKNIEDMRSRQRTPTAYGSDDTVTKSGKLPQVKDATYERRAAPTKKEGQSVNVGGVSVAVTPDFDIALTFELELNAQSTKITFVKILSRRQSELLIDMLREARLQTSLGSSDNDPED